MKILLDVATISPLWFSQSVLALITQLDGANAQLFHVEHCGNRKWQYQARWPDSPAPEYRDWGPVRSAAGDRALEPLMDPNVICEVRWRWNDDLPPDGEGDLAPWESDPSSLTSDPLSSLYAGWQDAAPHEWGPITASFHVIVKQPRDFRADPLVHAAGLVRGFPVAFQVVMPARVVALARQEILTLTGTALAPGPAAVLRESGEFVSVNDAFSISNEGSSQVTLLPVAARPPSALPPGPCYAVRLGVLPPEEIDLLRSYVADQQAHENSKQTSK